MADNMDVQVQFGAQTDGLVTGVDKATKAQAEFNARSQATSDAVRALDDKLTRYMSTVDKAYGGQAKLNEGVGLLEDNLRAGNISLETHDKMLGQITSKFTQAGNNAEVFGMSVSHAANGARALMDEISSGRSRQASGTFLRLFTDVAMNAPAAAGAIGGFVVAAGLLGEAALHAERMERAVNSLQDAFIATGRAADYTKPQLQEYVDYLAQAPGITTKAAGEAISELARIPDLSRPIFEQATGMVADFAAATGQKAPAAARALGEALADPLAGAKRLDKEFNFLTAQQMESIRTFVQQGDAAKAQQLIMDALSGRIKGLSDNVTEMQGATSRLGNAWDNLMEGFSHSSVLAAIMDTFSALIDKTHELSGAMALVAAQQSGMSDADVQTQADYLNGQIAQARKPAQAPKSDGKDTKADEAARKLKLQKDALSIEQDYIPRLREEHKLQGDINTLMAARASTSDQSLIKKYDEGIAAARQKLAQLQKPHHAAGAESQMGKWQDQYNQLEASSNQYRSADLQKEIDFWKAKLTLTKDNTTEQHQVKTQVYRLEAQQQQQNYETFVATERAKQAALTTGSAEWNAVESAIMTRTAAYYTQDSAKYQELMREKTRIDTEYAKRQEQQQAEVSAKAIDAQLKVAETDLATAETVAQGKVKLGEMTQQQYDQILMQHENQRYQLELSALQKEADLFKAQPTKYAEMLAKIEELKAKHNQNLAKLDNQAALDTQKKWQSMLAPVGRAFDTSIQGVIMGTTTMRAAEAKIFQSVVGDFISSGVQMVEKWAANQLAMTAISHAQAAERSTTETAAHTAAMVEDKTFGLANIMASAAQGAAAAWASTAAIPIVGPELAPAAAASAYGGISAFAGGLMSAAGGNWQIPKDQLAMVHKDESIIPAREAQGLRNMVNNGGGGGDHFHFAVQAMDSRDVQRFFDQHGPALINSLRKQNRNFNTGGIK